MYAVIYEDDRLAVVRLKRKRILVVFKEPWVIEIISIKGAAHVTRRVDTSAWYSFQGGSYGYYIKAGVFTWFLRRGKKHWVCNMPAEYIHPTFHHTAP